MVKKSKTTTWDVQNPVNNGKFTISTGAGFLPPKVSFESGAHSPITSAIKNRCLKDWFPPASPASPIVVVGAPFGKETSLATQRLPWSKWRKGVWFIDRAYPRQIMMCSSWGSKGPLWNQFALSTIAPFFLTNLGPPTVWVIYPFVNLARDFNKPFAGRAPISTDVVQMDALTASRRRGGSIFATCQVQDVHILVDTLPETNIAPATLGLEDEFPCGFPFLPGAMLVFGSV